MSDHIHLNRKELKTPDTFQQKTTSLFDWVQKNTKFVTIFTILVFLFVVGYFLYNNQKLEKEELAASEIYSLLKSLDQDISKISKTDSDWENKIKTNLDKSIELSKKYMGTNSAYEGFIKLGNLYYERTQMDKALNYFDLAIQSSTHKKLKVAAMYMKAYTLENLSKIDESMNLHSMIITENIKPFKADSMLALARLKANKGEKKAAFDLYSDFLTQFPDSPSKAAVESLKAMVQ